MNKKIIRNKSICRGSPTLEGRRLTVFNIVTRLKYEGISITANDMDITYEDIELALNYCSNLLCVKDLKDLPFCQGCALSTSSMNASEMCAVGFVESADPFQIGVNLFYDDYANDDSLTWLLADDLKKLTNDSSRSQ